MTSLGDATRPPPGGGADHGAADVHRLCAGRDRLLRHLRRNGWITCRVRAPLAYGVPGTLYAPGALGEPAVEVGEVKGLSYEDPRAPWVLARQMLRRLTRCTFVAAGMPEHSTEFLVSSLRAPGAAL